MPPTVFYEYTWRGERRAMICTLHPDFAVSLWNRLTGEPIEGPWHLIGGALEGDGDLSQTRRDEIAELLVAIPLKVPA